MTTPSDAAPGTAHAPESGAPVPETASLFEDFIDVFHAPSSVYERRRASGAWPYVLVVTILSAIFIFASRSIMSAVMDAEWSRQAQAQMAKNPRLTEEMMQQSRSMMEPVATVGMYLAMPLLILIGALLIWLGAKIVSAAVPFGRAVLIAAIAQVPRLVGALLTAIHGLLIDDTSGIDSKFDVGYSPARFMDPATVPAPVLELAARFDVFTLWVTVLMGIGVAVIARVPASRGMAAAGVAWGIATVLTLLPALWG